MKHALEAQQFLINISKCAFNHCLNYEVVKCGCSGSSRVIIIIIIIIIIIHNNY